ncbi:MAG TPA: cytochrome o ubiquinol oxidase subunit I [Candidatus Paceibacterota bacterium]|nr:cytochrome o ubiquinol oxidase subunit I [Candidatus Paceibacterota bacterium]
MFGELTFAAFNQGPIVLGVQIFIVFGAAAVLSLITYLRRWQWLWKEWLTSLDAKKIGIMYLVVAVVMLLRGFSDAVMLRAQQALSVGSSTGYLTANHFDQVFTAHGTIMIFFVAMPIIFGLINLVLPLQLGARDVAFPFLNSLSFWLYAAGAALIMLSLVVGEFAATGWLAYPPLSELQYSPGVGVDYWIWALQISGAGSLIAGINFVATIITKRAPGMTLMRMPIFAWTALGSMTLVVFAFPVLTATLAMLALDRYLGMHFFTAGGGGNMMMYVNLIWTWGHPEVYILALPAFGVFSEVVPVFAQKRLFGYTSMVAATISITLLSFVVWLHHFFTMGATPDVNAFFGIMTMVIAIPTGVKIFNWLFTMFRGRIIFATPMLWFLGFVSLFTMGGMAGVLMAVPGADFQLHNSLFLVAHFHTMIISGVLFGFFAAVTYWFPKIFGFTLDETWGKRAFWCWTVGFMTAFMPLYILGFMGATRRLDHYPAGLGWQPLFIVAAMGVVIIALGGLCQAIQIYVSVRDRKQRVAGPDPWNARTLEWSVPSPVPFYNFAHTPQVEGRDDFWLKKKRGAPPELPAEDIELPRNTSLGMFMAGAAFVAGFGLVWHIWWLVAFALVGFFVLLVARSFADVHEELLPAAEVARLEAAARAQPI